MNVLLTGGYSFLGLHIAEKCYREGHRITIIDKTAEKKVTFFKHKYYCIETDESSHEDIFRSNEFTVVIYVDAYKSSSDETRQDPFTDNLANFLKLSVKYDIKKFIFISSVRARKEIEGSPCPSDIYGINIQASEFFCLKWKEIYNLNTLCLRLPDVYCPASETKKKEEDMSVKVAKEAIYSALKKDLFGIYDLDDKKFKEDGGSAIVTDKSRACMKKCYYRTKTKREATLEKKGEYIHYLETFFLFLLLIVLTVVSQKSLEEHFDFSLFFILIAGIINGIKHALLATFLSCAFIIYQYIEKGKNLYLILSDTKVMLVLSLYILSGLIIGYIAESKERKIRDKDSKLRSIEDRYKYLSYIHNENLETKKELMDQIVNNEDSYGKVYSILMQLDSQEPEGILYNAAFVIQRAMKIKYVNVYTLNREKKYGMLVINTDKNSDLPKLIKINERHDFLKVLETREIFINKELIHDLPMISIPLKNKKEIIAIACIQKIEMEKMNLHKINICKVTADLISYSLSNAFKFNERKDNNVQERKI